MNTMVRRILAGICCRGVSTFCLGFVLGLILHIALHTTLKHSDDGWIQENEVLPSSLSHLVKDSQRDYDQESSNKTRILCYILTGPKTHHTSVHVKNTWGQRCDKTIFFSTKYDENLQPTILKVPEGYTYLWAKAKAALSHLHAHHPHYDWYLKADDDTYVIVENLRYFLKDIDPQMPVYYGVKFNHHVKQGYMSGGGGYVLSREALRKFVTQALRESDQDKCETKASKGAEDLLLGECLESVGVMAGDSLDEDGRSRFFSHSPLSLFFKQPLINKFHWYWRYIWHKHGVGPDCCSRHLVTFHDIDPRMMWTLEALLYRVHIHRDLQPQHLNTSTSTPHPPLHSSSINS